MQEGGLQGRGGALPRRPRRRVDEGEGAEGEPRALQKLLDDSRERAAALAANRFPAPERIECTQYSSKARYLTQKLHADVSLLDFLRALYKTTVE